MRFDRDQAAACFAADLSDQAKLLWLFSNFCGRGLGKLKIAEGLGWGENDVVVAAQELVDAGVLRVKTGRYVTAPFLVPQTEVRGAPATPPGLANAVDEAFVLIERGRESAGVAPLGGLSSDSRRKLTELVEWLHDAGTRFEDYLAHAVAKTAFLREKKGVKYPTIVLLCGDWLRDEWCAQHGVERPSTEHAGKRFDDPVGLREKLAAAGFDRAFTKGDLRYISDCANNMIVDPVHFPEAPDEFRREVYWLKRKIEAERAST